MYDHDIKNLFDSFSPDLSSDFDFMKGLERNLDKVEIVKARNVEYGRRQRRALVVASVAGFIAGVIFTCLMPLFGDFLAHLDLGAVSKVLADSSVSLLLTTLAVALMSLTVAFNSYEISLALMSRSCRKRE